MRDRPLVTALGLVAGLVTTPALAHHRQTPPIVPLTQTGDTPLPRLPSLGRSTTGFVLANGSGTSVVTVSPYKNPTLLTPLVASGDNQNLAMSFTGTVAAWDTDANPLGVNAPGRQIVVSKRGTLIQATSDPSGTSVNPSLDVAGQRIAFESMGDLAGLNPAGVRQVYLRQPTGQVVQMSAGNGTSRNAVLSAQKGLIAFESTSDAVNGNDTGIEQIWFGTVGGTTLPTPLTNGKGPSTKPVISNDGAVLAFQSTSDLADTMGGQPDTGVPQIYIYHVKSNAFARITQEPVGCTDPGVYRVKQDWRISYICDATAYFYMLRADDRYRVQTPGGVTTRAVTELGIHFLVVSTTADLMGGVGTTPGRQIYQINLYKRPAELFTPNPNYVARWFPIRGVPPIF